MNSIARSTVTFLLLGLCIARAQNPAPALPAPVAPAPAFTWGGDVRFRNEYYNSSASLNNVATGHEQDYFRTRARLWATYTPLNDLVFNVRAASEPRTWIQTVKNSQHKETGTEWRYVIIDSLNAKLTTAVAGNPLTVTIGRQDLQFGDNWLIYEGSPLEGSFTVFFDAVRATIDLKKLKTRIDAVALEQRSSPDDHLPVLGRTGTYAMTEQDENGAILHASNKSLKTLQIDGYFICKSDTPVLANGVDADIYTFGMRFVGTPAEHWQYVVEAAHQFGNKKDPAVKNPVRIAESRDISANGFNGRLTYLLKDGWSNQFSLIGEYLSADDPGTSKRDEMFDVLWGRYPRWSEINNTAFSPETGNRGGQYNNLIRAGLNWTATPLKKLTVNATYTALLAPQSTPTRAGSLALFSRDGHFRGHYVQASARHQFTRQFSALLFGEVQTQGDFYSHRETMTFFRGELLLTF